MNIKENNLIHSSQVFVMDKVDPDKKNLQELLKNKQAVSYV